MIVTVNVLSRGEGPWLLAPVNPGVDPDGEIVSSAVGLIYRWRRRGTTSARAHGERYELLIGSLLSAIAGLGSSSLLLDPILTIGVAGLCLPTRGMG